MAPSYLSFGSELAQTELSAYQGTNLDYSRQTTETVGTLLERRCMMTEG